MAQFELQCSLAQIPTYLWNQARREENTQIIAMNSCFNLFFSLGKVFWLAGSLLIIGLASVVNPTIGWRWLIRIASIPGILLILVFKFIPESARYNISTGNVAAAMATLRRIAKMSGAAMPEGVLREPTKASQQDVHGHKLAPRAEQQMLGLSPQHMGQKELPAAWQCWPPAGTRLGIAFAYYGVILASAELLERDLVCGSAAPPVQDPGDDSEESHSPCHCRLFGPAAYQTMIISTVGEIARNPFSPPCRSLFTARQYSLQSF
ncbi:transporter hypothetical protein [Limosa lapponica baueri]|uniref:Major facilitator superfamily (MFS) profile domain-containing protein n=1 Tax=Limosa lapponica baueri TaxID=1758121 RepID=A0A2I0TNI1_LIMLA|nr:transporter hypothetical protein [Limosa lapponica baueri]